eukprot:COSAG01_NODE_14608_length_1433_cov_1.574963_1_plen_275_part_10
MVTQELKIAIIGLGYVGLPLAMAFSKHYAVTGFDLKQSRISALISGDDCTLEFTADELKKSSLRFTSNLQDIQEASIFIVTVPTPIDEQKKPDLCHVKSATEMIGGILKPGDCVIYESTVYPGVTEDVCAPILENQSGLRYLTDFHLGYSPERLSPGLDGKKLEDIIKIVAASDQKHLDLLTDIYGSVVKAGIYKAESIKVAEAAKVLENTQRDVNIALMNEVSKICHLIDIDTQAVIDAAATKWNFMKVTPGLVGGHCIGVDPNYRTRFIISQK